MEKWIFFSSKNLGCHHGYPTFPVLTSDLVHVLQGEDVVAGIRTPEDIDTMRQALPDAYKELLENCNILESHYKEMMVWRLHENIVPDIYLISSLLFSVVLI
jgi:hypothetical protein